ncbi:MAG: transposase [Ignavibacteria bacterium]|nr:transposase [Ignavibacteria bacterium]
MRSSYKILNKAGVYFMTSTIVDWIPVFTSEKYFQILINAFKFHQQKNNLKIYSYVILDNHFHIICSAEKLAQIFQSIKSFTARTIIDELKKENKTWLLHLLKFNKKSVKEESDFQLWQEGLHPKEILNENILKQKINYIHYNPVKRGYVLNEKDWKYSSARLYSSNEECGVDITRLI